MTKLGQPLTTIKEMQMKAAGVTFPPAKLGKITSEDNSCAGQLACWHPQQLMEHVNRGTNFLRTPQQNVPGAL